MRAQLVNITRKFLNIRISQLCLLTLLLLLLLTLRQLQVWLLWHQSWNRERSSGRRGLWTS